MGLTSPNRSKAKTSVLYSGKSEAGRVRAINQDSFFVGKVGRRGFLAIVADGMGGHKTGEVASQKAIEVIRRELSQARHQPPTAMARAVQSANLEIFEYADGDTEHQGMGTTLTVIYIDDQVGLVGHIGDSRAYLLRDGEMRSLTHDHSWVADQVRQGLLTEEDAKRHHWRNVITNALGAHAEIKLDIMHFEVQAGDKIMLCSDGINTLMSHDTMTELVQNNTPEDAVNTLMEEANTRGSPDNITAVVLEVEEVETRVKNYRLPTSIEEPETVQIGYTMSGIRKVEEAFPPKGLAGWLRRQAWFPYRYWVLASAYLLLLFVLFAVLQR